MANGGNGPTLQEQMLIWMGACLAVGLVVVSLPTSGTDEFRIVPDPVLRVSDALGLVLLAYGILRLWRAVSERQPSLGATAFAAPLVGLAVWAAPVIVEVALH